MRDAILNSAAAVGEEMEGKGQFIFKMPRVPPERCVGNHLQMLRWNFKKSDVPGRLYIVCFGHSLLPPTPRYHLRKMSE